VAARIWARGQTQHTLRMPRRTAAKTPPTVPDFERWLMRRHDERDDGDAGTTTKGERTRGRLLQAAARQLRALGFERFGVAAVCREAGVTRTALYRHFPHKQALVLALVAEFQAFLGEALRQSRGTPARAAGVDPVLATNLAYVRLYRAHAPMVHAVQQARQALDDAERLKFEMNEQWARKVALSIDSGADAAAKRAPKARPSRASREALATAYALEAMVDGFLAEWLLRRNPHLAALDLSDKDVARVLTAAWRGAMRPAR